MDIACFDGLNYRFLSFYGTGTTRQRMARDVNNVSSDMSLSSGNLFAGSSFGTVFAVSYKVPVEFLREYILKVTKNHFFTSGAAYNQYLLNCPFHTIYWF